MVGAMGVEPHASAVFWQRSAAELRACRISTRPVSRGFWPPCPVEIIMDSPDQRLGLALHVQRQLREVSQPLEHRNQHAPAISRINVSQPRHLVTRRIIDNGYLGPTRAVARFAGLI